LAAYRFFDWDALLGKLGGDADFVRQLLVVALRSNETVPAELREACATSDLPRLARLAHKVKGTAGDLVADALGSRAHEAELAARAGGPGAVDLNLELATALEVLLDDLRKAATSARGA
jgi:HPt (histidine-containing phosphotransfer) domain-containing protein